MRIFYLVTVLFFSASANAATLNYISSDSQMSVLSSYADNSDPYYPNQSYNEEYNLTASAPDGNLSDYTNTLVGNGAGESGNHVSGTFSGLSDTSGFYMAGSVDNWEAYNGSFNNCDNVGQDCEHIARLERTVRFTVAESTTLYLETDWSDLQGYYNFPVSMGAASELELLAVTNPDSIFGYDYLYTMGVNHTADSSSGQKNHAIDIGPGTYEVRMSMFAQASGQSFGGEYSGMSGALSVSTIPIPGAVWLFGSALAGLGIVRRRKIAT